MEFKDKNNKIEYKKYQGIYIYIYCTVAFCLFIGCNTRLYKPYKQLLFNTSASPVAPQHTYEFDWPTLMDTVNNLASSCGTA